MGTRPVMGHDDSDWETGTMWSEAKASTGEHCQPHSFGGALLCAGRAGPKSSGLCKN